MDKEGLYVYFDVKRYVTSQQNVISAFCSGICSSYMTFIEISLNLVSVLATPLNLDGCFLSIFFSHFYKQLY